jgi:hypothetical protein
MKLSRTDAVYELLGEAVGSNDVAGHNLEYTESVHAETFVVQLTETSRKRSITKYIYHVEWS